MIRKVISTAQAVLLTFIKAGGGLTTLNFNNQQ